MSTQKQIKAVVKALPVIGPIAKAVRSMVLPFRKFPGSHNYWEKRYINGGTSGAGSYNRLAVFKANAINTFIDKYDIHSVIEFGSGDGNQLGLANYKNYVGFDVSNAAINLCRKSFAEDKNKVFKHTDEYADESAELSLSLDVIYHLIEDAVFDLYMRRLFNSAQRFVIIYSSNDEVLNQKYGGYHVKHRRFTDWVALNALDWELMKTIPNQYPYIESDPDRTSWADFYFYQKRMPAIGS